MPESDTSPFTIAPAHLTACLTTLVHGPYADADTASVGDLTAEAIRYLNYAAPRGGITEPATVATLTASLATAAYRLPQLLAALGDWLQVEAAAGRLADDHHRPPDQLTTRICTAVSHASDRADELAAALNTAHNLAATLHAAGAAAPAAPAA
jgi:hypothetical protein